ncbi:MAG: glycosyltransferase, partial [Spirochaetaceae bacterium]|nr:glycosyltransferase [Spirochaetaceae bacterium]
MKISVIINTYNRAPYLKQALEALRYQTYGDFEVVVVNGPSADDTDCVLSEFEGDIKNRNCASRNISTSRNIGIKAAQGEIVAFLDDDAVPDQFWLANIASGFEKHNCSILGGFVFDNTGFKFQARYILVDRHANTTYLDEIHVPQQMFCFPGTRQVLAPMGCNVAFRRRDLVAAGGFDEQYDYFLDETDVVVRMIDMGFTVRIEPSVIVYHRFAPSGIRKEKWPLNWTSIVKNRLYYVCANNFGKISLQAAEKETEQFVSDIVIESKARHVAGSLTKAEAISCITSAKEGLEKGKEDATSNLRKSVCWSGFFQTEEAFLPYRTIVRQQSPLVLCLLSPAYPPASTDGIPRYTKILAEGLAQRGCVVHVITLEGTSNTVDFENGVWIHRMGESCDVGPCPYAGLPAHIWQEVAKYKSEVVRINGVVHRVDLVQGPIWDLAPLDLLFNSSFSTGIFMCTSFAIKKELEPAWYRANKTFVDKIITYEGYIIRNAKFLNFDSEALYSLSLKLYGDSLRNIPHRVIHLGTPDKVRHEARAKGNGELNILFVGRL